MRTLATTLGISPQTLYTTLRLAVQALMLVRRGKRSVETLTAQVRELRGRLAQAEQAYATAQAEVQRLTKALAEAQAQVVTLQAEVMRFQEQGMASLGCPPFRSDCCYLTCPVLVLLIPIHQGRNTTRIGRCRTPTQGALRLPNSGPRGQHVRRMARPGLDARLLPY